MRFSVLGQPIHLTAQACSLLVYCPVPGQIWPELVPMSVCCVTWASLCAHRSVGPHGPGYTHGPAPPVVLPPWPRSCPQTCSCLVPTGSQECWGPDSQSLCLTHPGLWLSLGTGDGWDLDSRTCSIACGLPHGCAGDELAEAVPGALACGPDRLCTVGQGSPHRGRQTRLGAHLYFVLKWVQVCLPLSTCWVCLPRSVCKPSEPWGRVGGAFWVGWPPALSMQA